jgi:translation elongation factor EF-Tu-like GTPase
MKRLAILLLIGCAPKPSAPPPMEPEPAPAPGPAIDPPAPEPAPVADVSFKVEDSFHIAGRGPVAMGRLKGHVEVGDKLVIEGSDPPIVVEVLAVELMRDRNGTPAPDSPVGLLLRLPAGIERDVLVRDATMVRAK